MHRPAAGLIFIGIAITALTACSQDIPAGESETGAPGPADTFLAELETHCGKAYSGTLISADPQDSAFAGADMIAHFSNCEAGAVDIAFHVKMQGDDAEATWDRSRTWQLRRTDAGLQLKHDHRHPDGSKDAVTNYGGDTADAGSSKHQTFPVDAESIALFKMQDLEASVTNIWSFAVNDAELAYGLAREGRDFRVAFDLSTPITPPPPAWGYGRGQVNGGYGS